MELIELPIGIADPHIEKISRIVAIDLHFQSAGIVRNTQRGLCQKDYVIPISGSGGDVVGEFTRIAAFVDLRP